jgi:two-component system CheB/CheR fusion protein
LVALSGYGQPDDKRQEREAGFDEHLTKPVIDTDIARAMERLERAAPLERDLQGPERCTPADARLG